MLNIYSGFKTFCPDVFKKYSVKEYLCAFGLCVHPDYRGLGISVEILKARYIFFSIHVFEPIQ